MPTRKPTSVERLIVFACVDAMIEEEIKKEKEREERLNALIGRKYVPQDNSYIREIVNGKKKDWGALIGVPCEIISQPYITEVDGCYKGQTERMIQVKSLLTGYIYEVMFCESWICD